MIKLKILIFQLLYVIFKEVIKNYKKERKSCQKKHIKLYLL